MTGLRVPKNTSPPVAIQDFLAAKLRKIDFSEK